MARYIPLCMWGTPASIPEVVANIQTFLEDTDFYTDPEHSQAQTNLTLQNCTVTTATKVVKCDICFVHITGLTAAANATLNATALPVPLFTASLGFGKIDLSPTGILTTNAAISSEDFYIVYPCILEEE